MTRSPRSQPPEGSPDARFQTASTLGWGVFAQAPLWAAAFLCAHCSKTEYSHAEPIVIPSALLVLAILAVLVRVARSTTIGKVILIVAALTVAHAWHEGRAYAFHWAFG